MQILLIMLIVVLLAFSVLLLALAKQSPREKQTEDKEQEEYIRDYAETVRQTGGSMKKLEHWKVIAIYLIIYDMIAVNFSYFTACTSGDRLIAVRCRGCCWVILDKPRCDSPHKSIHCSTMEVALVMPSTPVLIYGLFVLLFILIAIPAGRMIDKANKETDDSIRLLLKRRDELRQITSDSDY